jgi:hypothetical protein
MLATETSSGASLGCPLCGTPNDAHSAHCTQCGGSLEEERIARGMSEPLRLLPFQCDACGTTLVCEPSHRALRCPFCDSPYVIEREGDDAAPSPDLVVPFHIEKQAADGSYRAWLGSGWLRPGDLMRRAVRDGISGVYVPCWMFSALAHSEWAAEVGEDWWETVEETYTTTENGKQVERSRSRRVKHTEWFPLAGRHHRFYAHEIVSGSMGLDDIDLVRVQPFDPSAARRYRAAYLAGWAAEEATVDRESAWPRAQERFESKERAHIHAFLPGDASRALRVSTSLHRVSGALVLLPFWIVTYRYRNKTYRFLMNGQTGRSAGTRPLSWPRVIALAAAVVLLCTLLIWALGGST